MKKTYINPQMEVVKIAVQLLLPASPNGTTNGLDPNASSIDAGSLDGRGDDFDWDD